MLLHRNLLLLFLSTPDMSDNNHYKTELIDAIRTDSDASAPYVNLMRRILEARVHLPRRSLIQSLNIKHIIIIHKMSIVIL